MSVSKHLSNMPQTSMKPLSDIYKPANEAPVVLENRNLACVYVALPLGNMGGYPTINPILRLRELKVFVPGLHVRYLHRVH